MATAPYDHYPDLSSNRLTATAAHRLGTLSRIDPKLLVSMSVAQIGHKFRLMIDPYLLSFAKMRGKLVKNDDSTDIEHTVPSANVHIEFSECNLLGYFPPGSKWSWYFPFACRREHIVTVQTDEYGYFYAMVPRWEIEWVLCARQRYPQFPLHVEPPAPCEPIDDTVLQRLSVEHEAFRHLDLQSCIGPFQRNMETDSAEWTQLNEVPDISFRITQVVDAASGVEEEIYNAGHFQIRWEQGWRGTPKIVAQSNAKPGQPCLSADYRTRIKESDPFKALPHGARL